MRFFDIGANLSHSAFAQDLPQTLERARQAEVERIVVTGTTVDESMAAARIAEEFDLHATAGVHPHHARDCGPQTIPALRSLGWREMENLVGWSALAGPRDLPREVVERWASAMAQLAHDPDWIAGNRKLGGVPAVRSPTETQAFVRAQFTLYYRLAQRIGMRE